MDSRSKTPILDAPLQAMGFEFDEFSAKRITGRLKVTPICCQPFKVLHGGVSALVAESLASLGAMVASGFKRVAGVQLSINHLSPAKLGDDVVAEAQPIKVGRTIQVWEVKLWKVDPSAAENRVLIASSKVTLVSNMPVPNHSNDAMEIYKKRAKL
ncbi:1,4-dihydroxy-2-naphthoyl-CoA thioesterase 1-like [Magnolia sinica]|uniref:1,4-dihydroxy-2-naphthoyl-CoA thioesterase 1-like n=1 Tax=Magnolia sinica TaxID=86752 RepID=UPI00265843DB|nr:1,4-dihydroxy-2-naphthoyl-CoA thioesterase 1-like [Magnolia sinica]